MGGWLGIDSYGIGNDCWWLQIYLNNNVMMLQSLLENTSIVRNCQVKVFKTSPRTDYVVFG